MSGFYTTIVCRNILPLSVSQFLPEAFKECYFTGYTYDYGKPVETCQLCEKEELRYHFQIMNSLTEKALMVGSQCILKFDVAVFEDGLKLDRKEAASKLNRLVGEMRLTSCLQALEKVADSENNDILRNAVRFYRNYHYLSPKQAFVVLWRLKKHQIDHNPSFFKINLKNSKYRHDLETMSSDRLKLLLPALSASQRKSLSNHNNKRKIAA